MTRRAGGDYTHVIPVQRRGAERHVPVAHHESGPRVTQLALADGDKSRVK